jgi:hypothetical protein
MEVLVRVVEHGAAAFYERGVKVLADIASARI